MKSITLILQILLLFGMVGFLLVFSQDSRPPVVRNARPIPLVETPAHRLPTDQRAPTPPRYYTHPEFTAIMTTTVTTPAQDTAEGYLFVATMGLFYAGQRALLIRDNRGEPIYIQPIPDDLIPTNFTKQTVQGKDYLTYNLGTPVVVWTNGSAYVMDESYTVVDQWTVGNGYGADEHEFLLLSCSSIQAFSSSMSCSERTMVLSGRRARASCK